jgi:plastocyanin
MMRVVRAVLLLLGLALLVLLAGDAPAAPGDRADVSIQQSRYNPASLRIAAGTSVVWTNLDNLDHTVVAEDGSFNSGVIKSGRSFRHTFAQKGTYAYGCRLHPRMRGTIIVE